MLRINKLLHKRLLSLAVAFVGVAVLVASACPQSVRTATQVVCASNAKDKTNCDFIADGVADDVEIQAAINALPGNGIGIVQLSEGLYTISARLTPRQGTWLRGVAGGLATGGGSVVKVAAGANITALGSDTLVDEVKVSDIVFDGNKANNTSGDGINFSKIQGTFADITVTNFVRNGFRADATAATAYGGWFFNVHASGNGDDGIYMLNWPTITTWMNVISELNGGHGFYGEAASGLTIVTSDFGSNSKTGLTLVDTQIARLVNIHTELNTLGSGYIGGSYWSVINGWHSTSDGKNVGNRVLDMISNRFLSFAGLVMYNAEGTAIGLVWDANVDSILNGGAIQMAGGGSTPVTLGINTRSPIKHLGGYVNENSGTATVIGGTTAVVVSHGLAVIPTLAKIHLIGLERPTNDVGTMWVSTPTATQFTVNVRNSPGVSNFDIGWSYEE